MAASEWIIEGAPGGLTELTAITHETPDLTKHLMRWMCWLLVFALEGLVTIASVGGFKIFNRSTSPPLVIKITFSDV